MAVLSRGRRGRARGFRGFTLVELLAVVAILGLLAAVVTVNVMNSTLAALRGRVKVDMAGLRSAVRQFHLDTNRLPRTLSELWQRPGDVRRWGPQPYVDQVPPLDPWGREYVYEAAPDGTFHLLSHGSDGAPGGEGDAADLDSRTIGDT